MEFPRHIDAKAKDIVKKLLTQDRTKRLGCIKGGVNTIKTHKWFTKWDWDLTFAGGQPVPWKPEVADEADTANFDEYPDSEENEDQPITEHERALFDDFDTF